MLLIGTSCASGPQTTTNLSANLAVYLDAGYTTQWDAVNQPDLSAVKWEPNLDGWQTSSLIVYLWNTSKTTLDVDAENNTGVSSPGFEVSSETVSIKAGDKMPLDIILEESPYDTPGNPSDIWFNVRAAG